MTRAERIVVLRTTIAEAQNEIDRLETEQANEDNQNFAVGGDPANGTAIFDNTGVDGQAPVGAPSDKETYADPKYWTVGRLQQEIDSRNPERKAAGLEEISTQGKRAELVERLLKDDEELAAAEGQED